MPGRDWQLIEELALLLTGGGSDQPPVDEGWVKEELMTAKAAGPSSLIFTWA